MTTFSDAFRSEVARVARKAVASEVAALRKSVSSHRSEIAALKRLVKAQGNQLRALAKAGGRGVPVEPHQGAKAALEHNGRKFQFNAEVFIAKRKELELSQKQMAILVGASPAAVYRWETGKVGPRTAQTVRIREALRMGKRAARAFLEKAGASEQ